MTCTTRASPSCVSVAFRRGARYEDRSQVAVTARGTRHGCESSVTTEAPEDHAVDARWFVGVGSDARPASRVKVASRVEWVDTARGIGIFLVVFAHDLRGLKLIGRSPLATQVDQFVYAFHMPLFFFLAGLFATHSARRGAASLLSDKLRTIAYPYFLWSLLQGALQLAMTGETNSHLTWRDLAAIPYQPIMQFWFLYTLFLVFVLFLVCQQLRAPSWAVLALGIGLSWLSSTSFPPRGELHSLSCYFIYFALGFHFSELTLRRL